MRNIGRLLPFALLATTAAITACAPAATPAKETTPVTQAAQTDAAEAAATLPKLEHMAVWAKDLEKTSKFLTENLGWKRHPIVFGVNEDDPTFGGMKLAFIDANGFWIELVQPTTEGPGMEFLNQKGNGSLVELDFAVPDFGKTVAKMKTKGIDVVGMDGNPLRNGGLLKEWVIKDGKREDGDELLMYLPMQASAGTSIELFWEYPNGALYYRDEKWPPEVRTSASAPRLDHTVVMSANLPNTTKVYTETLGLETLPLTQGLNRDWMGVDENSHTWVQSNGTIWIELVAPSGEAGNKVLGDSMLGDGALVELGVEVPDINAFYDAMAAKGIKMTAGDGAALPAGQKAITVTSSGDRFNYFPLDKSEGMRILVFQRGPAATSVFAKRDAG
jgi:catechol 2,3-dioxygenase-like lactoylglutathione lyase family enzyme